MIYLSCFSGIGGLEASHEPVLFCESDDDAATVLRKLYPDIPLWPDVRSLAPPNVDVVAGGWPCQDLSVAGLQAGLKGLRSGLLLEMLRVAKSARAHSLVAENVPNLLRIRRGEEFAASLEAFRAAGFPLVAWRVLNAREFGLPQNRSRVILIASRIREVALTLFREVPTLPPSCTAGDLRDKAAGFYWTGGIHSINYSRGYVPTIKVGSSLGIISPPAVHYENVVRMITPKEALALQGFDIDPEIFPSEASIYKTTGNAVPVPIGRWVMDGLNQAGSAQSPEWVPSQGELWADACHNGAYPQAGMYVDGSVRAAVVARNPRATNLLNHLDNSSQDRLSARASFGLLDRLRRSGQTCPPELKEILEELAEKRV